MRLLRVSEILNLDDTLQIFQLLQVDISDGPSARNWNVHCSYKL